MLDYISGNSAGLPTPLVPARREQELIAAFTAIADTLREGFELRAYLGDLAARCAVLARADAVVATVADDGGLTQASAAWPADFPALELFTGPGVAGPHQHSLLSESPVAQPDLSVPDARWPGFAAAAMAEGIRSTYSRPIRRHATTVGVVTIMRARPGGIPRADLRACGALADAAAVSLLQQRIIAGHQLAAEQLRAALTRLTQLEAPAVSAAVLAVRAGLPVQEPARDG